MLNVLVVEVEVGGVLVVELRLLGVGVLVVEVEVSGCCSC